MARKKTTRTTTESKKSSARNETDTVNRKTQELDDAGNLPVEPLPDEPEAIARENDAIMAAQREQMVDAGYLKEYIEREHDHGEVY